VLHPGWLLLEPHTPIRAQRVVGAPSFQGRESIALHDSRIGEQPQQTLLGDPAKRQFLLRRFVEPVARDGVMNLIIHSKANQKFTSAKKVIEIESG
jgi:hypothetical protein